MLKNAKIRMKGWDSTSMAVFSFRSEKIHDTVVFSFVYDNYYPIMD